MFNRFIKLSLNYNTTSLLLLCYAALLLLAELAIIIFNKQISPGHLGSPDEWKLQFLQNLIISLSATVATISIYLKIIAGRRQFSRRPSAIVLHDISTSILIFVLILGLLTRR